MQNTIFLSQPEELSLQIENVTFRLLIHKPKGNNAKNNDNPNNLYATMHSHISTELFVCKEGEVTLKIPGGFLTLKAGDALIIPPGIQHITCRKSEDALSRTISFICHKRSSRDGVDIYKHLSPFVMGRQIITYKGCPQLYDGVIKIISEASTDNVLPVLHTLELLLKMRDLPCHKVEPMNEGAESSTIGGDIQRMMKLDQLIDIFFMRDLTVDEIAGHLFISSRQLDRIVKKRYGKTLHQVIVDKRLLTAEQMLLSTDMTVDNISDAVGFGSKSGFYREFVRRYGMTPAEFRKNNQDINR